MVDDKRAEDFEMDEKEPTSEYDDFERTPEFDALNRIIVLNFTLPNFYQSASLIGIHYAAGDKIEKGIYDETVDALVYGAVKTDQYLKSEFDEFLSTDPDIQEEFIRRWWYEVQICRSVDAFQYYVSQILLRVFICYPDLLKRSDPKLDDSDPKPDNKVEIRKVLEAGSIEEFIRRYADEKVTTLGYTGLPKIIKYLNGKLSLNFDTSSPDFYLAKEVVEVRNIIVHNAGRVSRLYLQRTGRTDLQEGALYPYNASGFIGNGIAALVNVAEELDWQIVTKFKLK
ncbi:MAG: hypothetical protein ACJ8AG_05750 [Ktedonobacteraceae bacterium]